MCRVSGASAGEVAHSGRRLLCKPEDLTWISRTGVRSQEWQWAPGIPALCRQRQEMFRACWQASLDESGSSRFSEQVEGWEGWEVEGGSRSNRGNRSMIKIHRMHV